MHVYLEAVLIRHKLLGFSLVDGLCRAPRGLRGHGSSAGAVEALCQVKVRYLDADLIAHNVLELHGEKSSFYIKKLLLQLCGVCSTDHKQNLTCRTMLWMSLSIVKAI